MQALIIKINLPDLAPDELEIVQSLADATMVALFTKLCEMLPNYEARVRAEAEEDGLPDYVPVLPGDDLPINREDSCNA